MEAKQWQELCGWAGFELIHYQRCTCHPDNIGEIWYDPDNNLASQIDTDTQLPPQNMNTLFKWMVPKLNELKWALCMVYVPTDNTYWVHFVSCSVGYFISPTAIDKDPFEALAQAIKQAVKDVK